MSSATTPRWLTPCANPYVFADTELSEGIGRHGLRGLLGQALGRQRRPESEPLQNLLGALLTWPLLKVGSIHCFCAQLCQILVGKVSVVYDFLGLEDINWRGLSSELARRVNLQTDVRKPERWVKVQLVFSAPVRAHRADTWVLFLCTDLKMNEQQILEAYSLRWSIEVYFKEIKQNLGFLKEQSGRYQVAYASVHLAAIRYLLLFEAMLRSGRLNYGEIRDRQTGYLQMLTYAGLLWQLFRALIEGALESLVRDLGRKVVRKVTSAIDQTVESFLNEALMISPEQVSVQLKAEKLGYL